MRTMKIQNLGLALLAVSALVFIGTRVYLTFTPVHFIIRSDFDQAVKLISGLHSKAPSLHGLKYRSIICTIVRNDPHLVEFLLRQLISGFSHIFVYDNNRILAGYDMNITTILAPFIAAGVVTHIPWAQNVSELLQSSDQYNSNNKCLDEFGRQADWASVLDTDEAFYYERNNTSIHTLDSLLRDMERDNLCGVEILWSLMYGEMEMFIRNTTLFEAYPRLCTLNRQGKVLARPSQTRFRVPHDMDCLWKNKTAKKLQWGNNLKIALVHYFSKSMEEFLLKIDQGLPPWGRRPIERYLGTPACQLSLFNYSDDYRATFLNAYKQLEKLHPVKPTNLRAPPGLTIKQTPDYALLIHLKYRCAKGHQFDNEKYLSIHPDAKAAVAQGAIVDGMYHFMANFTSGVKGCWKTSNDSFCEWSSVKWTNSLNFFLATDFLFFLIWIQMSISSRNSRCLITRGALILIFHYGAGDKATTIATSARLRKPSIGLNLNWILPRWSRKSSIIDTSIELHCCRWIIRWTAPRTRPINNETP